VEPRAKCFLWEEKYFARGFFTLQEIAFLQSKKRSARMHTAAHKVDVAGARMCQGTFFFVTECGELFVFVL
jgi:hypothetical protein